MKVIEDIRRSLRVVTRGTILITALPVVVGMAALQGFVVGPLTGNRSVIPNAFYKGFRKLFGIKVEFNKASAPVEKDRPVWFVANHMANADFAVLGSAVEGTFAGKGEILKWPAISALARAVKYVGLRRDPKFNPQSRAKIAKNFNEGSNTIMFPEGTTTDGKEVKLFRAGLITLLFGEKALDKNGREVKLNKDVVVQPIAIKVKSVENEEVAGKDELRNRYSLPKNKKILSEFWQRLKIKTTTIELTVFPALHPGEFKDAKEIINEAAKQVVSVINPGQEGFKKAYIPVAKPKAPTQG